MSNTSRNNAHSRSCVICLVAALTVFWLSGCHSGQTETTPIQRVLGSSEGRNSDNELSKPLRIGETVFPSHQEFLQTRPDRCATTAPSANQRIKIENDFRSFGETSPKERAPGSVTIDVAFHIITSASEKEGYVSEEVLRHQIRVLNDAFAGRAAGGVGTPTAFKFRLFSIDWTANDAWFNMEYREDPTEAEQVAKKILNRGDKSTLNIYTIRIVERPFGWARWPWELGKGVDGVVINYTTLPGGGEYAYDEGDTATHEVGHWLGLFHTFEGGCNSLGDEVGDTPAELGPTRYCPPQRDSCPSESGQDSLDNFMNYTYDRCMFKFTAGQARRMDFMHQEHRSLKN